MALVNTIIVALLISWVPEYVLCAAVTSSFAKQPYVVSHRLNTSDHKATHKSLYQTTTTPVPNCILKPPDKPSPSLAGTLVRCPTPEDRKCLNLKKILMNRKCYSVGTIGPCRDMEIVVVDKKLYEESNLLRGSCMTFSACGGRMFEEFMSYDQCCHNYLDITRYICPRDENQRVRRNMFGEGECEYLNFKNQSLPSNMEHTTNLKGKDCVVPDLSFSWDYDPNTSLAKRYPHLNVEHPLTNLTVRCNEEERQCYAKKKVLVPRGTTDALADSARCHTLLKRGPCPPGAQLVLDKTALQDGHRILPVCEKLKCPSDSVFLAKDQRCFSLRELQYERCSSEDIVYDFFGEGHCVRYLTQEQLLRLPLHFEGDECSLENEVSASGMGSTTGGGFPKPPCPTSDSNKCATPVVTSPIKPSSLNS